MTPTMPRFATTLAFVLACLLPATSPAKPAETSARHAQLPISFEANHGQTDGAVRFLARGPGYGLFLTQSEAVLALQSGNGGSAIRMRPVRGNTKARIEGLDLQSHTTNHFKGNDPSRWHRDVANYARVKYTGVYPGIDLVYYSSQRQLEYDFIVAPGADPRAIELAFEGVRGIAVDKDGNLQLKTAQGVLMQQKPVVYQEAGGMRIAVEGRYVLLAQHRVRFEVGRYDKSRALTIDPVIRYSTYLGGNGNDVARAIAVDAAGSAYITGSTTSTNFPGAGNALTGSSDVFVAKLNAAGALVYSTYIGGSGSDVPYAIAVDSAGSAYVTGQTDSDAIGANTPFPTVGAFQNVYRGGGDAFVTKLNAAGNALVYSTYLGGGGVERGYGIAVDASGSAYVTGHTNSDNTSSGANGGFPTANALQIDNAGPGSYDAFVTKFSPTGASLVYSTYLGGEATDYSVEGGGIAIDAAGNAYVGGTTASLGFPGASFSTIQPAFGGGLSDGFVAKINAAGSAIVYSTYLGGNLIDAVHGIAVDPSGNALVTGKTDSSNFPIAAALQPGRAGTTGDDAFIAKINAAGTAFIYSTYLGGTAGDIAYDIATDAAGNAYVSGWTASSNFPTASPVQANAAGSGDAFVVKLSATGNALLFGTYLGGSSGAEHAYGIAVDADANAYVTGTTNSTNFPVVGAAQGVKAAFSDAFVTQFRFPTVAVLTDLNGDARSDLLYRNASTGQVYRMLMNGFAIANGAMVYHEPNTSWKIVGDADFDGDGVTDLLWRNTATGQVFVMPVNASGVPVGGAVVRVEPSPAWIIVQTPDLDGDGNADILWWNSSTGEVFLMLMNGTTVAAQGFIYTEPNTAWKIVASGDFAGNGIANQLLWRNSTTGQVYQMTITISGSGSVSVGGQVIYQEPNAAWKILGAPDLDGNGKSDILWRNDSTGQVFGMLMNGSSIASSGFIYQEANLAWKIVSHGDYDGNGKADLLWRNDATGQVFMMLMNGLSIGAGSVVYNEPNTAWKLLGPREYAQ